MTGYGMSGPPWAKSVPRRFLLYRFSTMHAIQGVLPACCQIKVQKRRVSYFSSTPVAADVGEDDVEAEVEAGFEFEAEVVAEE